MFLFKCKFRLILATLLIFFFAIYSSAYANNIYCGFTDLKIELKSVEKLPPELSGLKLDGNIVGDGSLIVEIKKVHGGWLFQKVRGPKHASNSQNKFLEMFFFQKSHHAEYFEAIYGEGDIHPFLWGNPEYSAGGEFKFNITLDTGAEAQLLVSPKGFFSFIHDKVTIQAAGPCQHEN